MRQDNAAMEAEPSIAPPKCKRRWYQFSLRTLLIVVTLLAVPLGYVGWQARIVRERQAMMSGFLHERCIFAVVSDLDRGPPFLRTRPETYPASSIPWVRRILGDECLLVVRISWDATKDDFERVQATFPEVKAQRSEFIISLTESSPRLHTVRRGK
jgi:hypothetical protein